MNSNTSVFIDIAEYERIRDSGLEPITWCTDVQGYWVIKIPGLVYELEYRNLITEDEAMSIYIIWDLTGDSSGAKL